jgi:hypothetical protein
LFLAKAYAARFVPRFAPRAVVADQRVYSIHPRPGVDVATLAAVLNCTFTAFALESLGRASLGEGALEWTVADAQRLPLLDPRKLSAPARSALLAGLAACCERTTGTVSEEATRQDRAALDRAAASVAPGLADLLPATHQALIGSVVRRNSKARS